MHEVTNLNNRCISIVAMPIGRSGLVEFHENIENSRFLAAATFAG